MTWRYREAKERDERYRARIKCDWGIAWDDRTELIGLLERLEEYVEHDAGCPQTWETSPRQACDCGLDALLRELEGER